MTIGIIRTRDLISVVVLLGIYSFLMATVMVVLDAVDVGATAAVLLWATPEMPPFGSPDVPVVSAGPDYLSRSVPETGIPNVVTSTLASYRGYDTLGETTVIFIAGIGVLLLLLKRPPRHGRDDDAKV